MSVFFPSGECAIQSSVLQQQNQVYLQVPANPPGNNTITVQYHDSAYSGLFYCGGSLGHTAAFIESNGDFRDTQDTGLQRSGCDCWNIGFFSSYLLFVLWGKSKRNCVQQIQRTINANNAIFIAQELDGDGKSYEAVVDDQPTEYCLFFIVFF